MSAVTSERNKIEIGEGKDKKSIYTATKTTPTTNAEGNKDYREYKAWLDAGGTPADAD